MSIVVNRSDLFCGYNLTRAEEEMILKLSLLEFDKPKSERLKPFELVKKTRDYLNNPKKYYK